MLDEARREARRQTVQRERRARDAEELKELMDLLPSLPLLGSDHYGNRYYFLPRDYRAIYVLCDGASLRAMEKEKELLTAMGLQRTRETRQPAMEGTMEEVLGGSCGGG